MPIPMLVYGDSFQWEKYGHHILPSNLDLTSNNKVGLHQTFWKSLIEFLRTDLDGNLAFTLNALPAFKLDRYLSTFFEGLSETATKGKMFDQHVLNEKSKHHFINEVVDIALFATHIPLSIFTIYFTRGLKSIQNWNQHLKYYSRSIFKWRQNQMTLPFFLEIFSHTL